MTAHNVKPSLRLPDALPLHYLSIRAFRGKAFLMGEESSNNMSREERLAAKLRENLRRRKAQSREMDTEDANDSESGLSNKPKGS